jgi:hypothetical protein
MTGEIARTDAAWHAIQDAGLCISLGRRRIFVAGPNGTEPLARQLLANQGLTRAIVLGGCTCIDEPYLFGRLARVCLFHPGPFSRAEYSALSVLRARFYKEPELR